MKVRLRPAAADRLRDLPTPIKRRLKKALGQLVQDPFGHRGVCDVKKLRSPTFTRVVYRLKVGGWRAVYLVHGDVVEVIRVFPRDEGYGWMERFGFLD